MIKQDYSWVFEYAHCKIGFSVSHFGISETEGQFRKFEGKISGGDNDFAGAEIEIVIDPKSVDTDVEQRDDHLKSADFFDIDLYPHIIFRSTGYRRVEGRTFALEGELTMHGVTKPVSLNVQYGGIVPKDPFGNTKAGFKVTGIINRKDWNMTWNNVLDVGGLAVGNEVSIVGNIELLKVESPVLQTA